MTRIGKGFEDYRDYVKAEWARRIFRVDPVNAVWNHTDSSIEIRTEWDSHGVKWGKTWNIPPGEGIDLSEIGLLIGKPKK